ncbi:hypothetical protein TNCV_244151 [Trichonephila clavipes]|uniref:Uncharacterized protein n=1 Tax=Trichonephila clavipes TaxID=2585209 RepID=A0A8X6V2B5_TRICX|nr:hypothetical protein TNCV_244151 [Trichonephila clavipes]
MSYHLISFKKPSRKNSGLCIWKKRLTACLNSGLLPKRFSARFFLKPEIDKSPQVRDQDCMVDGKGTPNQEFQYGFELLSLSMVSHCQRQRQNARSEKPRLATYLIVVDLYPAVYLCLELSPTVLSFAHSH